MEQDIQQKPNVMFDYNGERIHDLDHIKISIIVNSRGRLEMFRSAMDSLVSSCSDCNVVEILLKIDADDQILGYLEILESLPFSYKLLIGDRLDGYWTLHLSLNDLAKLSHGKILWIYCDDISTQGDWVTSLWSTRNTFPDNIYVIQLPGDRKRRNKCINPAFSIEWFKVLNLMSPHAWADRFLVNVAMQVGRLIPNHTLNRITIKHSRKKVERPIVDNLERHCKLHVDWQVDKYVPIYKMAIEAKEKATHEQENKEENKEDRSSMVT